MRYVAIILSVCSMLAIYQAYLSVLLGFIIISIIILEKRKNIIEYFMIALKWFLCLLVAGTLYYVLWKIIVHLMGITVVDTYNGLSNADVGIILLKSNGVHRIVNMALLFLLPLALGFVKVFSGETFHYLMKYSYVLIYILLLILIDEYMCEFKVNSWKILSWIISVSVAIIIWNNIVFANQAYTEKALQEQQTVAYVTNMVNRIESYPGYVAGVTPVNFVGNIEKSGYFDDALNWIGMSSDGYQHSMITYTGTLTEYLNTIINTNMIFSELDTSEATVGMPNYPSDGSIVMVNDTIYVKLSD